MTLETGTKLGRYEIRSKIGAGGMGEVYLARDTKLDRKVALKILPADVASNRDRMERFTREAKSAAALNHPNIAHIYEIGESDGTHFIAMEFIDGVTLRDKIHQERTELRKLLRFLQHAAEGLAKAHASGIAHRDLKPDNIMITRDGHAKILDFGLAKLIEQPPMPGGDSTEAATAVMPQHSSPGTVLGTVGYMSPEQAQGKTKEIDQRSDIFSFGCILFEAVTGQKAFEGKDVLDSLHKIVHAPTPQISEINPNGPAELQRIVRRCLAKDPDKRYQSIKDVAIELEELRQDLKAEANLEGSIDPSSAASATSMGGASISTNGSIRSASGTAQIDAARTASSAEYLVSQVKRHKLGSAALFVIAAIILGGFGYGLYRFIEKPKADQTKTNSELRIQRLTGDGKTRSAAISPDGKFLVYRHAENDKESLWIKQIQTNSVVQVVKPGELERIYDLAFSPDANFVYFNGEGENADLPTVYRVPTLGGSPVKVLTNAYLIQFSPDGKQISFLRDDYAAKESVLYVANVDGTNERKLASRTGKQHFYSMPAWSPDGNTIAVTVGDDDLLPNTSSKVVLISVADGRESDLGTTRFAYINSLAWHPTGDSLIAQGGDLSSPSQVWEISYPSGDFRRLTNDLNEYAGVSITSDGNSIVTRERHSKSSIWVSPNLDPNNAKTVMPATGDTWGFAWTPDNRIVYSSNQGGDPEIWIMNSDGSGGRPLTSDRIFKSVPVVSPDGRSIVYISAGGGYPLVKIDINGGNRMVLSQSIWPDHPDISPDGRWVIYSSWVDGKSMIFRVPIEGGEHVQLTDYFSHAPRYSPDGITFACFIMNEQTQKWNRLAIVPADGGRPIKVFDVPAGTNITLGGPVWTPDGLGITFLVARGEQVNLWLQPRDGGSIKQLTNFDVPGVARRNYSRDGKQIAVVRAEAISNAVMITGFR